MGVRDCREKVSEVIYLNRFFGKSENIFDDYIIIDGGDVNHIRNVLRMKAGDELIVTGVGGCEYRCSIREFSDEQVILDIISASDADTELSAKVYLFQGIPKGDKMETIIQKCVELGVYEIVPVETRRSVVKLDASKKKSKTARWQAISESAAKQSHRGIVPKVSPVMSFGEALSYASDMDVKLIPYELCEGMDATRKAVESIKDGDRVAVFIGPEGGFEADEISEAAAKSFCPVSLGRRILRTETAGMTVMSVIMYTLETKR